jgi:hypothetical protein
MHFYFEHLGSSLHRIMFFLTSHKDDIDPFRREINVHFRREHLRELAFLSERHKLSSPGNIAPIEKFSQAQYAIKIYTFRGK